MAFTNNVMIVRHGLLAKLVKLWKENRLLEEIDRLPIELSPRKSKVIGRCCVHKERAVWKYKTLPLLGFDMQDEVDELTPLSEYAKQALLRSENKKENLMCVVDEACSSCVQVNYEITNLCRGCVARSCYMNCPKDAIRFKKNGQAEIDHDACISCGKCHQNCPYHAIVYIPIPCEEVCPVKAISKDEYGVEHIDESKCIYCGKCVNACPFGAIFEISQVFDILQRLRNKEPMVAIVAPSILAQFAAPVEKVYGAIKSLGFLEVVEVAQGAMETTRHEAEELKEKLAEGQPFMTTSCCPSYIQLAEKHIPDLKKYISTTGSPMYYTAPDCEKRNIPDAKNCVRRPVRGKAERSEYGSVCGLYTHVRGGRFCVVWHGYQGGRGTTVYRPAQLCTRGTWICAGRGCNQCGEGLLERRPGCQFEYDPGSQPYEEERRFVACLCQDG